MLDTGLTLHFLKKSEGISFDGCSLLHNLAAFNDGQWAMGGQELLETTFERGMPSSALLGRDSAGHTPLHTACHFGNLQGVQVLLAKAQERLVDRFPDFCNARDNAGRTALFMAAEKGWEEVVCSLLEVPETDASIVDNEGRLAACCAGGI